MGERERSGTFKTSRIKIGKRDGIVLGRFPISSRNNTTTHSSRRKRDEEREEEEISFSLSLSLSLLSSSSSPFFSREIVGERERELNRCSWFVAVSMMSERREEREREDHVSLHRISDAQ